MAIRPQGFDWIIASITNIISEVFIVWVREMHTQKRGYIGVNASIISIAQRFSDVLVIFFGLYLSYSILSPGINHIHLTVFFSAFAIFQMIGGITDFYRSWRGIDITEELKLVLKNWTLSIILAYTFCTLVLQYDLDNIIYYKWYIFSCLGLTFTRTFIRWIVSSARKLGYNSRRVAIAGMLPAGIHLAETFKSQPWLGFNVIGFYDDNSHNNENYLGDFKRLIEDARNNDIDNIYITLDMNQEGKIKELLSELTDTTCTVMLVPDLLTYNILQSRSHEVNGITVVPIFDTPMSGLNKLLKRIEDIIISTIILIFISPVLILISVFVKLTSKGPIIFKQLRYGMDGKPIYVWKFRSMTAMDNGDVVIQAKKGDARITPFGAFLRKTSLDELPQFINVLKGDMSVVGPRPHAVAHNELYRTMIKGYMLRHKVKPGITGWAQINGWRGETETLDKMRKRIEFDLEYIRRWSVFFDIKIVFLTVFKGFLNKSAY